MSGASNSEDDTFSNRIAEIVEQYLELRRETSRSPEEIQTELVLGNPDVPDLKGILGIGEMALSAPEENRTDQRTGKTKYDEPVSATQAIVQRELGPPGEKLVRLTCGHCGNKLRIVTQSAREISCPNCGSSIETDMTISKQESSRAFPQKIGRFVILGRLGTGAFGHAYWARDPQLARDVAIKVPRAGTFSSDQERERFVREAKSAARLRHPNIVQVHEVSVDVETPYLVCDLVKGITLADLITSRRLTFKSSAKMMFEIAMAVQFAHDNKIIHRDIKPGNILLDHEHNPYIADFGLARDTATEVTMTATGEILGTPAYMSPEQARGEATKISFASDVYSLGVVLYRMLCGELPFRGSQRMMLNQVLFDDPRPPSQINDSIPRDLETIVLKAMAKEPAHRYASARDFADDLQRWLNDESIVARPDGRLTRLVRWRRRHPAMARMLAGVVALTALVIAMLVAWSVSASRLTAIAQRSAESAEAHELESTQRLAKSHMQNGIVQMESGDYGRALVWLGSALSLNKINEEMQRVRIGMLWQRMPFLKSIVVTSMEISALEVSDDGQQIAIGGADGAIEVYTFPDFTSPSCVFSQGSVVRSIKFGGPENRLLLTTGVDDAARLWDAEKGEAIAKLGHGNRVRDAEFSPDNLWIATAGLDGIARIWTTDSGKMVQELVHQNLELNQLEFSPDSRYLAVSSRAKISAPSSISVWKLGEDMSLNRHIETSGFTTTMGFSPEGDRIFAGCRHSKESNYVESWRLDSGDGKLVPEYSIATRSRPDHAWILKADKGLLAVESNGDISHWNRNGTRVLSTTHPTGVKDAEIDKDQQFLVVSGTDGNSILYWLATLEPVSGAIPNGDSSSQIRFFNDGRHVAVGGSHGVVRLWDLAGLAQQHIQLTHSQSVNDVHVSPSMQNVLTASSDGLVKLWDANSGEPVSVELKHPDVVNAARFANDGKSIVTACKDHSIRIWNSQDGKLSPNTIMHPGEINRCKVSADDQWVVSSSVDGAVYLSRKPFANPLFRFNHAGLVYGMSFSPDFSMLATGSVDHTVRVWSTKDGSAIGPAIQHVSPVGEIAFSRDGRFLATACQDHKVRLWSIPGLQLANTLDLKSFPTVIEFQAADLKLLTSEEIGLVTVWNNEGNAYGMAKQVRIRDHYLSHAQSSNRSSLVMTFGDSRIMSGHRVLGASSVFLIDMESESLLAPPQRHCSRIAQAELSQDGRFVISGSEDGTALLWQIVQDTGDPGWIEARATLCSGWVLKNQSQQIALDGEQTRALLEKVGGNRKLHQPDPNSLIRWNSFVGWLKDNCRRESPLENGF